jgi:oligopeptide/dipeptide ABC transporter ATP-binding protein
MTDELLEVRGLSARFETPTGPVLAVDDVHLKIAPAETVGLVGESGCGKSTLAYSLLRLVPPPGRIVAGEILWKGRDLLRLSDKAIRQVRGKEMALIFQEPSAALNPVLTVGEQVAEPLRVHQGMGRREALAKAVELFRAVRIPDPATRVRDYSHQMSGGMKQRVLIAMAIACAPDLLIADEPTTALDVTIQAQILELLGELKEQFRLAILLVSHDLGIVAQNADRVAVMYAGRIVEEAPVASLFKDPKHPYTAGLLRSLPRSSGAASKEKLQAIRGTVPDLAELPPGCAFAPRCPLEFALCTRAIPLLGEVSPGHFAACYTHPQIVNAMGEKVGSAR